LEPSRHHPRANLIVATDTTVDVAPDDLIQRVRAYLDSHPEMSWDAALAMIATQDQDELDAAIAAIVRGEA
jgi:hypothetical protein